MFGAEALTSKMKSAAMQVLAWALDDDVVLTCILLELGGRAAHVSLPFWDARKELSQRSGGERKGSTGKRALRWRAVQVHNVWG